MPTLGHHVPHKVNTDRVNFFLFRRGQTVVLVSYMFCKKVVFFKENLTNGAVCKTIRTIQY